MSSPDRSDPAPDRRRRGRRSRRWEFVLAAAVLAGIALWQEGFRSESTPSTTTSPTPTATVSTPDPGLDGLRDPIHCPAEGSCAVTADLPSAVVTALRAAVPEVQVGPAATVRIVGGGLWFRQITARAGDLKLIIQVLRPVSAIGGAPLARFDPEHGLILVRKHVRHFVVQVQADAPGPATPSLATLNRLAADPRLLELS